MNALRCGLLGCGRHGVRYLDHLVRGDVERMRAAAVWRRDRRAAEESAPGLRVFDDWRELVASDAIDVVLVLTPPGLHEQQVLAAVDAGKIVLVEKPLTGNFESARRLAARLGPDAPVMVAQTLRFNVALERGRRLLDSVGEIHRVRIAQRLEPSPLAWQKDRALAGGGSITLTGVHLFDLLRWWIGATPDRVQCMHQSLLDHPFENLFDACFEFTAAGILAATEVSKFSASRSATIEVVGTRAQLAVDYRDGVIRRTEGREETVVERVGDVPTVPRTLAALRDWVEGRSECPVTVADGLATLQMAEACLRSQHLRRSVDVATLEPTEP